MEVIKIAIKVVLFPKKTWYYILHSDISGYFIFRYILSLALIGPVLSFISMYLLEKLPLKKVVLYSLSTYSMDIISVYIFAFLMSFITKDVSKKDALKISAFGSTPVWLSDVVDILQFLRPFSVVGFLYSLYLIYMGLKLASKKDIKTVISLLIIYSILYGLNSVIAESIVTNPVLKEIVI